MFCRENWLVIYSKQLVILIFTGGKNSKKSSEKLKNNFYKNIGILKV